MDMPGKALPPRIDSVVRTKRRTIGLEVTAEGLLVVRAPLRTPQRTLLQAVEERAAWVREKQAEAIGRRALHPPLRCVAGERVGLFGSAYLLRPTPGLLGAAVVAAAPGGDGTDGVLAVPEDPARARAAVEAWYRGEALAVLRERTAYFAACAGARVLSVRITGALTRWGSCRAGHICYSWRLAAAPREAADYVAAHEVSHIAHPDHSAAFWRAVAALLPDHEYRRELLREHAALLRPDFFAPL